MTADTHHSSLIAPPVTMTERTSAQNEPLPSFQALTKEFPSLKIEESIPIPPPPYQGPDQPPVAISSEQSRQHQPLTSVSAFPPPPPGLQASPEFHQQPPHPHPSHPLNYSHRQEFPQDPLRQSQFGPHQHYRVPGPPSTNPPPQFQNLSHPFTPPHPQPVFNFIPGGAGPPSSAIGPRDTNYIATSSPFPPANERDRIHLPDPAGGRRLSMQLAPYPSRHIKHDSYDSQGSLSTLADIASSRDNDLQKIIKDIEQSMAKYRQFSTVMHDMERKFRKEMEKDSPNGSQQRVPLAYEYNDSHGRHISDMDIESVKNFVGQIPVEQLRDMLGWAHELRGHFENWLSYRSLHAGRGAYIPSAPSTETKIIAAGPYIEYTHQRGGSFSGTKRHDTADVGRVHKRTKSTSGRRKETTVALVVKPPTPVSTSVSSSNQPTDIPNADLSRTANHKCKQCENDDTPEWRRGPYGSRSLCNACGLFYSKLCKKYNEKKAAEIMIERRDRGDGDDRRIPAD